MLRKVYNQEDKRATTRLFLQGCLREHFQLPLLHDHLSPPGNAMVPLAFVDLPPQELALFGGAIFEDFDQTRFPCLQVHLYLGLVMVAFRRVRPNRMKRGGGEVELCDSEMFQCS